MDEPRPVPAEMEVRVVEGPPGESTLLPGRLSLRRRPEEETLHVVYRPVQRRDPFGCARSLVILGLSVLLCAAFAAILILVFRVATVTALGVSGVILFMEVYWLGSDFAHRSHHAFGANMPEPLSIRPGQIERVEREGERILVRVSAAVPFESGSLSRRPRGSILLLLEPAEGGPAEDLLRFFRPD